MAFPGDGKVKVQALWGRGYVWDARDVDRLRNEFKIYGSAVGAVPNLPQQNESHGLPFQIRGEAVAYLLDKGVAELEVDGANRSGLESSDATGEASTELGIDLNSPTRIELPLVNTPPVVSRGSAKSGSEGLDYTPLSLLVFKDLMARSYAITDGGKFGATYLLYDDDPEKTHAGFTVRVNSWEEPLKPLQIIAASRVAHGARKHLLLASVDGDEEDVHYLTFCPEGGFSLKDQDQDQDQDD